MIKERLAQLRQLMAAQNVDAFVIPSSDFHASEYVGEYFKVLQFFSGFSGSAGTLVVTATQAGLWTDARYFLRAEQCLDGTGIDLYRMGEPDTPEIPAFLNGLLPEYGTVSMDGRMVSAAWGRLLAHALGEKRTVRFQEDFTASIWTDRPPLPKAPVYLLDEQYSGCSAADKITALRDSMLAMQVDAHLISSLDQIAWLLNIRGNDIRNNPVTLSYLLAESQRLTLFIDEEKLSAEVLDYLAALGVQLRPYDAVYTAADLYTGKRILLDPRHTNYALFRVVTACAELAEQDSPVLHAKARKNAVECENLRQAHIQDGLILTRFIRWLKTSKDWTRMSEQQVAQHLTRMRLMQPNCVSPSFNTIAAYGAHGADIHYSATPESSAVLEPRGFLLVDSGGQYHLGTTDVTRTIALGPLTAEEKKHFTLVLQAMLNLSQAIFPQGCCGYHLDVLARAPIWAQGLDFGHGTGHGIGYMLCVHEPPVGFHWKQTQRYDTAPLQAGHVISDEPGIYIPGSHGIRLENQLLCRECAESPGFLCFETLTLAPIDLDAVDLNWLDQRGRLALNAYHAHVYETLAPHLTQEERLWLSGATRAI